MPYYVIAWEEPRYGYDVVEGEDFKAAYFKWAADVGIEYSHRTQGEVNHTPEYDSGPWSSLERASEVTDLAACGVDEPNPDDPESANARR